MIGKKINQLATELAPTTTDLTIIGDPISGVSKKITLEQLGAIFGGAVSFYTTLGDFPATGVIDIIYCAKDTKKLYLWSGSAYVEVFPSQALLDTYQLRSEKGVSNGYASLDSSGKVPISQLPSSIMEYKGTWSAATNTPTLANGTGDTGDVYLCNAAGSVNFGAGAISFAVGDYVVYSGTIWQRSSGAVGTVTSVAASITGDAIGITGSPVTTSGTLALAFAGTSSQYINGAGNLTTFPTLTGYVPYTGATTNVNLGEFGITSGYYGFDLTPTNTPTTQGTMYWNADKESVDIIMNGVTGSVMQDSFYNVKNQTGSTIPKGTVVRASGTVGASGRILIAPFLADGTYDSKLCIGVTSEAIANGEDGKVTAFGAIRQIDTSAFANGTILYASPSVSGGFTSTEPTNPNNIITLAIVVYSDTNNGEIFVRPTFVDNAADIAAALGYTPQPQLNGTGFVKASGTTISYDNSTYYLASNPNAYIPLTALSAGAGISYNNTTGVIASTITQYTDAMARASISGGTGISYNSTTGVITNTITQYTDALARAAISLTTTGTSGAATYNSTTGVLNVPQYAPDLSGYVPTSRTLTINGTAYDLSANRSWSVGTVTSVGLSSSTSGVSIGSTPITSSGTITLAIATASGSQQGLLSSTDWNTFNNKQSALTNPVTGTGTTNYLPKFTGTSTIGNSIVQDASTYIDVAGYAFFRRGGKYLILNPNYNAASVYADIASEAGMGLSLSANGVTQQLYINTAGNVGIGVNTPSQKLEVAGIVRGEAVNVYGSTDPASTSPYLYSPSLGALGFGANSSERMRINSVGNVGIKTTSPNATLDIGSGDIYVRTGSVTSNRFDTYNGGATQMFFGFPASGSVAFNNGSDRLYLSNTGNLGLGTSSPSAKLQIKQSTSNWYDGIRVFDGSSNTWVGIGNTGSAAVLSSSYDNTGSFLPLAFYTSDSEKMRLNASGNLSIGNTNDTYKLDVTGTGRFSATSTDYALTLQNVQDDAQGLLVRATDNDGSLYLLNLQSSNSATGQTWVDRFAVTKQGNVGIGTASPTEILHLNSSNTASFIRFQNTGGSGVYIGGRNNDMEMYAGGSERMRLNQYGQLLINATSSAYSTNGFGYNLGVKGTNNQTFISIARANQTLDSQGMIVGLDTTTAYMTVHDSIPLSFSVAGSERMRITSGGNVIIGYNQATAATIGRTFATTHASGNRGAELFFGMNDGGFGGMYTYNIASSISGYNAQYIAFHTHEGAVSSGERMRITSGGNVEINTGSIKTGEPDTGYGRAAFKIGTRQSGTATDSGGYIPISIDGTVYFINLYTSTP
jgi:hypothetical protein